MANVSKEIVDRRKDRIRDGRLDISRRFGMTERAEAVL